MINEITHFKYLLAIVLSLMNINLDNMPIFYLDYLTFWYQIYYSFEILLWLEYVFPKAYEWKVCLPADGPVWEGTEELKRWDPN